MPEFPVAILSDPSTRECLQRLDRGELFSFSYPVIASFDDWLQRDELFLLRCDGGVLQLVSRQRKVPPLQVDFLQGAMAFRGQQNVRSEMLIKAVLGRDKQHLPSVTDATAGLGRDSFLLAVLGCEVVMVERHPIVSALLQDGLMRYQQQGDSAISARMQLLTGDFASGALPEPVAAEVVYLDPMFPTREKSALVKKEMQIFKQLVGGDPDSDRLMQQALQRAQRRIVVKRPLKADYLSGMKPTYSLSGRSSRFDVYQVGSAASTADMV